MKAGTDILLSARDDLAVGSLTAGAANTVTISSTNGAKPTPAQRPCQKRRATPIS